MNKPQLTYLDSNVLIYAASGASKSLQLRVLKILGDQRRKFLGSRFQVIETLPMARRMKRLNETKFLERYFERHISLWADETVLFDPASDLIQQYGFATLDALHLATAMMHKAEFVTGEKPTKPFHKAYANCLWIADR